MNRGARSHHPTQQLHESALTRMVLKLVLLSLHDIVPAGGC